MVMGKLPQKFDRAKRATRSYVDDQLEQAEQVGATYAVAAGLYTAGGVFALVALIVGGNALFRWVELRYGLFEAFGGFGGLLFMLAVACVVLANRRLSRPVKKIPSLGNRLRVALTTTPSKSDFAPVAAAEAVSSLNASDRYTTRDKRRSTTAR
jgi:hypothetical protein